MLNKTSSTEGIASKKSLELKKRYLLGEAAVSATNASLIKSDSSSVLDTKFKNFHSNISAGQKMLSTPSHSGSTKAGLVHSFTTDMNAVRQNIVWDAHKIPIPPSLTTTLIPPHNCSDDAIQCLSSATTSALPTPKMSPTTRTSTLEADVSHLVPSAVANNSIRPASYSNEKENDNTDDNQPPADTQTTLSTHLQKCLTDLPCIRHTVATPTGTPVRNPNAILYDSIDLCTPPENSPEIRRINQADEICDSQEFFQKLDQNAICGWMDDLSTNEALLVASKSASSIDSSAELDAAERSKVIIDTMLNSRSASTNAATMTKPAKAASTAAMCVNPPELRLKGFDRAKSDAGSTIIEVDSLSSSTPSCSSSTSSIDDIPHYVLESTTSPDTMLVNAAVVVGPHQGNALTTAAAATPLQSSMCNKEDAQLMQIDSLMIVNGQYVGDPEDLKHMRLPVNIRSETPQSVVAVELPPLIEPPLLPINSSFRSVDSRLTKSQTSVLQKYRSSSRRPELRFDTRNANKIDTLRNMPLISPTVKKLVKPNQLNLRPDAALRAEFIDLDKTPMAVTNSIVTSTLNTNEVSPTTISDRLDQFDSEPEDVNNTGLTETELSDWAADDAVSENFVDIEFALNSNKGTIRRNKQNKSRQHIYEQSLPELQAPSTTAPLAVSSAKGCPLAKQLNMDDIEFMDTGSEDSCMESYSATNQTMIRNRGYVQFVANSKMDVGHTTERLMLLGAPIRANPFATGADVYSCRSDAGYGSSPKDSLDRMVIEDDVKQRPGVDYIEQGACILGKIPLTSPQYYKLKMVSIMFPF